MISEIETTRGDRLLHIRLNRPAKRNAVTQAMYAAMADALIAAESDGTVAIIFSGAGPLFCAGNDLADWSGSHEAGGSAPVHRFLKALAATTRVLIAAVQGRAVGIGATMLLHCDFVLAEPDAVLSFPFVDLALVPEAASSMLLPRAVGHLRAAELLLLAEPLEAEAAMRLGLVTRVVPAGTAAVEAALLADKVLTKPEGALIATKRLLKAPATTVSARMETETEAFAERLRSPELQAAIARFFASRNKAA